MTTPQISLKPCPFCGSEPNSCLRQSADEDGNVNYSYHEIACENRECGMMPLVNVNLDEQDGDNLWEQAIEKAIAAWNTRQPERPDVRALEVAHERIDHHLREVGCERPRDVFNLQDMRKAMLDVITYFKANGAVYGLAALAQPEAKGGGEKSDWCQYCKAAGHSVENCRELKDLDNLLGCPPDAAPGSGPSDAAGMPAALKDLAENPVYPTQQQQDIASHVLSEEMGTAPDTAQHQEMKRDGERLEAARSAMEWARNVLWTNYGESLRGASAEHWKRFTEALDGLAARDVKGAE